VTKKYIVDVDGRVFVEISADCVQQEGSQVMFVLRHEIVASFTTWRYWKCETESCVRGPIKRTQDASDALG
jgi:hypothetical protein